LQNNNPAAALSEALLNGQPSTELLTQVLYIMENLHIDLSATASPTRLCLEEGLMLTAFQSHTGNALDQFVPRRLIERALHPLKKSDARNSGFAAGVVWETAPIFHAAVVNYQEEGFCRNSRRRVEKGASARPSLTVFRRKNLVDGRFQHSRFSN
jgi:hypothetical protein